MKRFALLLLILFVLPSIALAGGFVFGTYGTPGALKKITLTDTAQTLQAAYDAATPTTTKWNKTGPNRKPCAVVFTVETYGIRYSTITTPTVDNVGMVIAAAGSARWAEPGYTEALVVNAAAGSNAVMQVIPEYCD